MDFHSFSQNNGVFTAHPNRPEVKRLPPGHYKLRMTQNGDILFEKFEPNYDDLIDLPSPEYEEILREVMQFLSVEGKKAFADYGFLYKLSFLLHGIHGTGKTCIVNRIGEKVVEHGGIVLFDPDPRILQATYRILNDIQPEVVTMVAFEEFDWAVHNFENLLLSLLDGEIQKENIIYVAATNHLDDIPARLQRPGRFSSVVEVKFPGAEARRAFLKHKLPHDDSVEEWVRATDGLSIDEVHETVRSVKCMKKDLFQTIKRIKLTSARAKLCGYTEETLAKPNGAGHPEEKVMLQVSVEPR